MVLLKFEVPRSWSEQECRELFEQYGPVHQLNVLRDKATQISKGYTFLRFSNSLKTGEYVRFGVSSTTEFYGSVLLDFQKIVWLFWLKFWRFCYAGSFGE